MRILDLCIVIGLAFPAQSVADDQRDKELANRSPYEVDLALDLPVTFGAGVVSLVPELVKSELGGPWCGLSCDPSGLNGLDRKVLGNHSSGARIASDALVISGMVLPHLAGLLDALISKPSDGWGGYAKDSLVLIETLAVSFSVNQVVKYAVRRPRPFVYDATLMDTERTTPDAALSFYSGHTSTVFCMATAYSYTFTKRHPNSPLVIPVWLATHALAATTGVLRVEAGKHFWTDVLAGAAIGSTIGFLVPYLHTANRSETTAGDSKTQQLGVALGPAFFEHGLGLGITIH